MRHTFLLALILCGTFAAFLTEILSFFKTLTPFWTAAGWAVLLFLSARAFFAGSGPAFEKPRLRLLDFFSGLSLAALGAMLLLTAVTAWQAPPNNYDSMTYHMSRVMHWIDNKSVAHYPTHILRQLHLNPWAEFAIMHLQILTGSDRLANFVQWSGFLGSILAAGLIAKEFGAGARAQITAGFVVATIPMAVLQSSSTQNDLVVSFWLSCFAYFALRSRRTGNTVDIFFSGLAVGLAILTKATAYLFGFPLLLWWFVSVIKNFPKKTFASALIVLACVTALNAGHWTRNLNLYGSPLGPTQEDDDNKYTNDIINLKTLSSNVVRNLAIHLGIPCEKWDRSVERAVSRLHDVLKIDEGDPGTTTSGFRIPRTPALEDETGNPLHLFLIFFASFFILLRAQTRKTAGAYLAAVLGGFLLFCLVLKWQPWHSRLHLPVFILAAPLAALALEKLRPAWLAAGVLILLFASSLTCLTNNQTRPLFGPRSIFSVDRDDQYFALKPDLKESYRNAVRFLKERHYKEVGLFIYLNDWEYPLWALSRSRSRQGINFHSIDVENVSEKISLNGFKPDAVIVSTWALSAMPPDARRDLLLRYARRIGPPERFGSLIVFGKK